MTRTAGGSGSANEPRASATRAVPAMGLTYSEERRQVAEFDYTAWLSYAMAFSRGISKRLSGELYRRTAPPRQLLGAEIDTCQAALGFDVPIEFRKFLDAGLAGFRRSFCWGPTDAHRAELHDLFGRQKNIYFGPKFIPLKELPLYQAGAKLWATNYDQVESDEAEILLHALPFIGIDNGDFIAMDLRHSEDNPPVVFFAHEEGCFQLSRSLTRFLECWERLAYIGPEIWMLRPFIGMDGSLNENSEKASKLRAVFGAGI